MKHIRNFCIIAHIDHGKSTLSDRFIQFCGGLSNREMEDQVLDSMELEKERGITIKAQSVTLYYKAENTKIYQLNFIDTPGHVDFVYEINRSLAACEGALLVVDATQGVEAQTLANCRSAIEMNLPVIPVLNKIDLPSSDPKRVMREIENILCIDSIDAVHCSAKTGFGVLNVLERLIRDVPAPKGDINSPLQALIVDSWFDNYLGVVALVRVKNGILHKGEKIKIMSTGHTYHVDRMGMFTPKRVERDVLRSGEVGWLVCSIKNVFGAQVGDTLTTVLNPAKKALFKIKKPKPLVYAALFPIDAKDYEDFRRALEKLSLNDSSLFYEQEISSVLGFGFRCGFLGLLHMEIVQERLEREYNLSLIITSPTVVYELLTISGEIIYIDSPTKLLSLNKIKEFREPIAECQILVPQEYLGNIIQLCSERRGIQTNISYHDRQISLSYEIPMCEIVFDFFNYLKSSSHGYASLDYNFKCFKVADMVRLDVLINSERLDPLSLIIHRKNSYFYGRTVVEKIKNIIPRHQFDIVIQAVIGTRIIAKSHIKQLRKNVLSKCYGGDVTRKKKLLQKQKEGKKRMKQIGHVKLPKEAFLSVLNIDMNRKKSGLYHG